MNKYISASVKFPGGEKEGSASCPSSGNLSLTSVTEVQRYRHGQRHTHNGKAAGAQAFCLVFKALLRNLVDSFFYLQEACFWKGIVKDPVGSWMSNDTHNEQKECNAIRSGHSYGCFLVSHGFAVPVCVQGNSFMRQSLGFASVIWCTFARHVTCDSRSTTKLASAYFLYHPLRLPVPTWQENRYYATVRTAKWHLVWVPVVRTRMYVSCINRGHWQKSDCLVLLRLPQNLGFNLSIVNKILRKNNRLKKWPEVPQFLRWCWSKNRPRGPFFIT